MIKKRKADLLLLTNSVGDWLHGLQMCNKWQVCRIDKRDNSIPVRYHAPITL